MSVRGWIGAVRGDRLLSPTLLGIALSAVVSAVVGVVLLKLGAAEEPALDLDAATERSKANKGVRVQPQGA